MMLSERKPFEARIGDVLHIGTGGPYEMPIHCFFGFSVIGKVLPRAERLSGRRSADLGNQFVCTLADASKYPITIFTKRLYKGSKLLEGIDCPILQDV